MNRSNIECSKSPRKHRKKLQRYLTKKIRKLNKRLEEDPLWRGRFVIRQIRSQYYHFFDNSGGELYFWYNIIDKKTGYILTNRDEIFSVRYQPWLIGKMNLLINDFIVNKVGVWENEKPYDEVRDWTSVELPSDWHDVHWEF